MDSPPPKLRPHPNNQSSEADPVELIYSDPSCSSAFVKRKNKKKKVASESTSSACSGYSSLTSSQQHGLKLVRNPKRVRVGSIKNRRSLLPRDVDALGLPLGMSIAAVVAQVLERRSATAEKMSVDYLSSICILAVRESLANVFGDKFDSFVINFEKSFCSTLTTLRLISESSQSIGEIHQRLRENICSVASTPLSFDSVEDSACSSIAKDGLESLPVRTRNEGLCHTREHIEENGMMNLMNRQLVLHNEQIKKRLSSAYAITASSNQAANQSSMLSTIEKSVMEQTRSNDLKMYEIGLMKKKLQLKERQISLSSDSNFLERWKLSMGFSKASFKTEKFKTQLQDTKQVELLKTCLDFLVSGLIIMLCSLAYGTYVYSYSKITEITESCSPFTESKSWWIPKSMSTFNSGLHLLRCQIQIFSRMLFGIIMIAAIALLLIQRSSASHQTMPVTFLLLLLGVGCGYAGKFCIHTLGGDGYRWLIYWEVICFLHFFSNIFPSYLYVLLNGPLTVVERPQPSILFPHWMRKSVFYSTLLLLPLLCGFMPFASFWDWIDHFSSLAQDFRDD